MSSARFTINGTPYAQRGFDAVNGATVTLQLEDQPALDVGKAVFSVYEYTRGAPTLLFTVPALPNGQFTLTMPASGAHTYGIQCQVNDGTDGATGRVVPEWTAQRVIAIRASSGHRKILPSERDEYLPQFGWTDALNEVAVAASGLGGSGTVYEVPVRGALVANQVIRAVPTGVAGFFVVGGFKFDLAAITGGASPPTGFVLRFILHAIVMPSTNYLTMRVRIVRRTTGFPVVATLTFSAPISTDVYLELATLTAADFVDGSLYQIQADCQGGASDADFATVREAGLSARYVYA